jgi:P4 family phage/plasmid primase-like protien
VSFREILESGYTDLVSVIPPGAVLSATSKVPESARGKSPGRRNANGVWAGYDWLHAPAPTPGEVDEWERDGASLGLRSRNFPAVDIDCPNESVSRVVAATVREVLGWTVARIGNWPKQLLLYRTTEPFPRRRLRFTVGGERQLVEVLGDGQQFVIAGIHATTGHEYSYEPCDPTMLAAARLPAITAADVDTLFEILRSRFDAQATDWETERSNERTDAPEQSALTAEYADVAAAVACLPNDRANFPTRDDYLRIGYAIKAALPDDPAGAFDLWWGWCERWEEGTNTLELAREDWERLKPPFAVGAPYLFDRARAFGYGAATEFGAAIEAPATPAEPPAPAASPEDASAVYSDRWLSRRFIEKHGDEVRYCGGLGGWLRWDGRCWRRDETKSVDALAAHTCNVGSQWALNDPDMHPFQKQTVARRLAGAGVIDAVLKYTSIDQSIHVPITVWDADPWLLNTPRGVVDLRTGVLHESSARRMMTQCTEVGPSDAQEPTRWLAFLRDVTGGDRAFEGYLQRLVGYALTGSTREHALAFLYGSGGNGKSVFLNTVVRLLGSYAKTSAMDTFTASKNDKHPTELAALVGARVVTAQETQADRSWDEAKIKSITGGDPVTARFMYKEFFTFTPQFKLLFAGNHRPHIANLDPAMRRRFHLVPFTRTPEVVDPDLTEALRAELPAIFAWAITGCIAWQAVGLQPPPVVVEATQEYFADEDPLGRWLAERTQPASPLSGTTFSDLFSDWRRWCNEHNERVGTERALAGAVAARGYLKWKEPLTRRQGLAGIALRESSTDTVANALLPPVESALLH